ncbi:MAG: sugar phosphate isomerase/epimerase [Planctomycetes bacterium]|nr:sugar phosphate isomerase/epimerase [Planctomycetota bacterium]
MRPSQIAINSVSTTQKDIEEALTAYSAAGFRNVEFVLPKVKKWLAAAPGRTVGDVKNLLAKHNITCIGGFEAGVSSFGDAEAIKKNHELHIENSKIIGELGGGTIVVGTDGDDKKDLSTLKTIGKTLGTLIKDIHPQVNIAVEFNWSPVVKSIRSAAVVVEEACHGRVGILFDPAHYHCTASKFEDLTEKVVRKIIHVHVDDMLDKPGDVSNCNNDRVLPGEGTLDLRTLFAHFDELGYRGHYSIEMFNADLWAMPATVAAKKMYESMARLCD